MRKIDHDVHNPATYQSIKRVVGCVHLISFKLNFTYLSERDALNSNF